MAAELAATRPVLTVIEGGRSVEAWELDEARMELAARRREEQAFAAAAGPLLRRLELMAREIGPAAWQTVAALASLHERHGRRWADGGDVA